ncbi:hypothetical protein JKP88DRAFT_218589 [Tribonema minus]|uniref:Uncharacterized protein n=1 Tax=Tribonema minus TaxID=303371 RepID=A0A835Z9J2_9STRA|nr:hypothetical protein JKP88DRAFT_218589 [Tribonema minus]
MFFRVDKANPDAAFEQMCAMARAGASTDPWDAFGEVKWSDVHALNRTIELSFRRSPFTGLQCDGSLWVKGRFYENVDKTTTLGTYNALAQACGDGVTRAMLAPGWGIVIREVQVDSAKRRQGVFKGWLAQLKQDFGTVVIEYVEPTGLRAKLEAYGFVKANNRVDIADNPTYYWTSGK